MKNNIKRNVGIWEKGIDGKYKIPTHDVHTTKSKTKMNESDDYDIYKLIKSIYPIIMKASIIKVRSGDFVRKEDATRYIIDKIKSGDESIFEYLEEKTSGYNRDNFIDDINKLRKITQNFLNEDLAVWFGTKKKSKGSKQPKGPWVNICRKVDGKHPPCGRPEASDKGYPKCRAAGVAGRMSDSQKKAACAKKRRDEKTHSKSGKGNKPKMSSYKPRKEEKIDEIVNKVLNRINNVL